MKASIIILSLLLVGCFDSGTQQTNKIQLGKTTFKKHCATCHGEAAQGVVKDWKKRLPNGMFPAPPLNGTAHTWHHSPEVLLRTIENGGAKLGGWMPAFRGKLNNKEKQALLDYLYSLWPEDVQQKYKARFK